MNGFNFYLIQAFEKGGSKALRVIKHINSKILFLNTKVEFEGRKYLADIEIMVKECLNALCRLQKVGKA